MSALPYLLSSALIVVVATAAPASAQQNRMRFFEMDRNGDGVITRAEWRGSDQSFRVHDWNLDGILSGDEVRQGGRRQSRNRDLEDFDDARGESQFTDWTEARFNSLDRNRDNRITRNEWVFDRESFIRADNNGDNVLTRREFLGFMDEDDDRDDRFTWLDVNNDGRLSRDEWHGSRQSFDALDRNRDGVISRVEARGEDEPPPDLFTGLDTNRDGMINRNEWQWSARSFNDRDTNNDGRLSRAEFNRESSAAAPPPSQTPTYAFRLGWDRGLQEGRAAGREDFVRKQGWDLEGQRELETADSGYQAQFGPRVEYQSGYRQAFRLGYREAFEAAKRGD